MDGYQVYLLQPGTLSLPDNRLETASLQYLEKDNTLYIISQHTLLVLF